MRSGRFTFSHLFFSSLVNRRGPNFNQETPNPSLKVQIGASKHKTFFKAITQLLSPNYNNDSIETFTSPFPSA